VRFSAGVIATAEIAGAVDALRASCRNLAGGIVNLFSKFGTGRKAWTALQLIVCPSVEWSICSHFRFTEEIGCHCIAHGSYCHHRRARCRVVIPSRFAVTEGAQRIDRDPRPRPDLAGVQLLTSPLT
jgi:hypothetical protein